MAPPRPMQPSQKFQMPPVAGQPAPAPAPAAPQAPRWMVGAGQAAPNAQQRAVNYDDKGQGTQNPYLFQQGGTGAKSWAGGPIGGQVNKGNDFWGITSSANAAQNWAQGKQQQPWDQWQVSHKRWQDSQQDPWSKSNAGPEPLPPGYNAQGQYNPYGGAPGGGQQAPGGFDQFLKMMGGSGAGGGGATARAPGGSNAVDPYTMSQLGIYNQQAGESVARQQQSNINANVVGPAAQAAMARQEGLGNLGRAALLGRGSQEQRAFDQRNRELDLSQRNSDRRFNLDAYDQFRRYSQPTTPMPGFRSMTSY